MHQNNDDDDLFLSDIGSLSQIYDKKTRFGKNFNPNYKKRGSGKPGNPYLGGDKRTKPSRFDKHFERNIAKTKEDKAPISHPKPSDNFQSDKSVVNLYEDEDIQVISHTKSTAKDDTFTEGMYDEFELNVNSKNESPKPAQPVDPLTKTKNDAPWRLNRESRRESDAKRLLEYERSFQQDELLGNENFQNPDFFEEPKHYPVQPAENQAKSVRSFHREQLKFDENYSKWAYDDAYDNEDKSSDEKESAPYDPEQYDDNNPESFDRERFANPESRDNSNTELLDENYPNAAEMPPYRVGKIVVENKLEKKLRKEDAREMHFRMPIEQNNKSIVNKSRDEDVIILDDSHITENKRVQNEVNKKIKISFTTEHKPKSVVTESIFPDDTASLDILFESSTPSKSGQKIPVLSRKEPPKTQPTTVAVTTVPSFPPPVSAIPPRMESIPAPQPTFTNTTYPLMSQNFMNYNFATPNMSEMPPGTSFIPGRNTSEFFANNPAPPGTFTTFPENVPHTPHGWIPPSVNQPMPNASMIATEKINFKESQKSDKPVNNDAVKDEIRQQNKKLMDQRDQYYQKYNSLNDELNKLKKQKKSLVDKKSHQAEAFLKENNKLQSEIQNKIRAVKNIIDMLSKIIKDDGPAKGDNADESFKRSSAERDESGKESHKKSKRKHSRSKSRHRSRSRSRSRGRRSRSHSHSRSRHRSRTRSRSRSHSPKRHRRRSRSRDKYYRRRRSHSKEKKSKTKKSDKEETQVPKESEVPVAAQPTPEVPENAVKEVKIDTVKSLYDRFKPSFEEVIRPVEPPKPVEIRKVDSEKPQSRFTDKPLGGLPINAVPEVPATLVEKIRELESPVSKGYIPDRHRVEPINYVYYDPEIHWCRVCNVFPKTAKEYLLHLHAAEHKQVLTTNNLVDYPWHKNQPDNRKPVYPNAPTERIPIRGLPFFVSATAWYCKLCNEWMGDLHCASAHLKSDAHEVNYMAFLDSNPNWDVHWQDSRNKAFDALRKLKAAESITPAYSTETYVKPSPAPPPPPPLQLREKKKKSTAGKSSSDESDSSSSSTSSSSSGDDAGKRKKKKKERRNERKRSPAEEKTEKFRLVITDAKKARELAKKAPPKPEVVEQRFEAVRENPEDDKFVEEWMNPVRGKSKEREFAELKNKLKKKEVPDKAKPVLDDRKKPSSSSSSSGYRRHGDSDDGRTRHEGSHRDDGRQRHDDDRSRYKSGDPRSRRPDDDKFKRPRFDDSRSKSSFSFNKSAADRESSKSDDSSASTKSSSKPDDAGSRKPSDRGGKRFPFIGKMPSKNAKKSESGETRGKTSSKGSDRTANGPNTSGDGITPAIQKQIEEYDKANDVDIDVVDMDINDDEDEPVSIVIDDNISRKKDFDETLKLLYPEEKPPQSNQAADYSSQVQQENVNAAAAVVAASLPPNITQDYLVSLIESTLVEKLKFKIPAIENQSSQILEIASSMQQALFNSTVPPPALSDIPIPFEDTTTVHIMGEEQLYNVPLPPEPEIPGVELDDQMNELAPPGTTDDVTVKKKKNPISQKKRRHLRKIREKLEEQEKLLQEKIEERKNLGEEVAVEGSVHVEAPSPPRPINAMDSDLMMLGIDEDDSAALLF